MEPEFWIESWQLEGSKTSFHRPDIHPYVLKYAPPEFLEGKRVLVPLAGKTNDLEWFRQNAMHTTGIELVERPIRDFFSEHDLEFSRRSRKQFVAQKMTFFCTDLFELTPQEVGPIDFIYDRASLIAFPYEMRLRYLEKMDELAHPGTQTLLITLEYEPRMDTPPFSVTPAEVEEYYGAKYSIEHIEWPDRPNHGMKYKFGLDFVKEHGFLLTKM